MIKIKLKNIKRLRLFLLPFGAIIELFALLLCWLVAMISKDKAESLMLYFTNTLPSIYWYIGE